MGICGKELLYALVVLLGPAEFGYITVYCSPKGKAIRGKYNISDDNVKWTFYNSIVFLTAAFGPFVDKWLLTKFNGQRKKVIFITDIICIVGWFFNCVVNANLIAGIFARAILGLATGMFSGVTGMYLVELSPPDATGFFGSLNQIGIVFGQALFSFLGPHLDFMAMNYFAGVWGIVQAIAIWFIPESPAAELANDVEEKPLLAAFQKQYLDGLFVGIILMFIQQLSGINALLTNLSDIMSTAGLKLHEDYQSGISIVVQLFSVFVSSLMVDKLGRKMVWIISSVICAAGLILMALHSKFHWGAIFPLICIILYIVGFGLGLGPVPWYVIPEFFTPDVRPAANSICVLSNWVFGFIMVFAFPAMKKSMKDFGCFLFFGAICVFSIFFGIFKIKNPSDDVEDQPSDRVSESSDEKPSSL